MVPFWVLRYGLHHCGEKRLCNEEKCVSGGCQKKGNGNVTSEKNKCINHRCPSISWSFLKWIPRTFSCTTMSNMRRKTSLKVWSVQYCIKYLLEKISDFVTSKQIYTTPKRHIHTALSSNIKRQENYINSKLVLHISSKLMLYAKLRRTYRCEETCESTCALLWPWGAQIRRHPDWQEKYVLWNCASEYFGFCADQKINL